MHLLEKENTYTEGTHTPDKLLLESSFILSQGNIVRRGQTKHSSQEAGPTQLTKVSFFTVVLKK